MGANDPITKLDTEGSNQLSMRLFEHVDAITNAARRDIAWRLAARRPRCQPAFELAVQDLGNCLPGVGSS